MIAKRLPFSPMPEARFRISISRPPGESIGIAPTRVRIDSTDGEPLRHEKSSQPTLKRRLAGLLLVSYRGLCLLSAVKQKSKFEAGMFVFALDGHKALTSRRRSLLCLAATASGGNDATA